MRTQNETDRLSMTNTQTDGVNRRERSTLVCFSVISICNVNWNKLLSSMDKSVYNSPKLNPYKRMPSHFHLDQLH